RHRPSVWGRRMLTSHIYRTEAFSNLRTQLFERSFELEAQKRRVADLEAVLSERDRELVRARSECKAYATIAAAAVCSDAGAVKAVEEDSREALDIINSSERVISESLRADLATAREKLKSLQADFEQQNKQLLNALVDKDKLRGQLAERDPPPPQ